MPYYPYRYFSFTPESGSFGVNDTVVINLYFEIYQTYSEGRIEGASIYGLVFCDESGNYLGQDNNGDNYISVSYSGRNARLEINLASCTSDLKRTASYFYVNGYFTVYTKAGSNETTSDISIVGVDDEEPKYGIIQYTACKPPTNIYVSSNNVIPNVDVTLSWSGASAGTNNAIARYEVYRATSPNGTYSYLGSVSTSSTSGSMTVKAPSANGSTYYYKVKTIGSQTNYDSELSSAYASLTCSYSAPGTPGNVTINGVSPAYAKKDEEVLLSWGAASSGTNNPVTGYVVYRDGVEYKTTTETSIYVQTNENAGGYYTYAVFAKGTYADGSVSSDVRVYTYSDPIAPRSVTINGGETAVAGAGVDVSLSWSGADSGSYNPIVGYQVYRDGVEYRTTTETTILVPSNSEVGGEYSYSIKTLGQRSNSGVSSAATVYSYSPVTAPDAVSVSNLAPDAGTTITLYWSGANRGEYNEITGYRIYEDIGATGSYKLLETVDSSETSGTYALTVVGTNATTCRYKVSTIGTYGESGMSSAYAEYTTKTYGACTPPTSVTISKNNVDSGGTVTLYWSGAQNGTGSTISGYAVYRSTVSDRDYTKLLETDITQADVTASETEGQIYYYKVQALAEDRDYNSELSSAYVWLRTNVTTGIGGNSVPASAAFHAAIKNGEKQRALIYFYDDGLWLTNDDITASGIQYENYFCSEEDMTIGLTPCSTASFSIFNEKHRLDNMRFGRFRASIGAMTSSGTFAHKGNVMVIYEGDEITGHDESPYVRVNGIGLLDQPNFSVKSIFMMEDVLYCLGENEQFIVYKKNDDAERRDVMQYTWQQVAMLTWNDLRSLVWGEDTRFVKDNTTQIISLMLSAADRYVQRRVGIVVESDDTISDYLPNGKRETYTYVDLGIFYAEKPERTKTNIISVEGYDGMSKFDVSTEEMKINFPVTLYGLLDTVCGFVGIKHKVKSFPNQGIELTEASDIFQNTTAREVLGFIAEAAGANAKVDYDGELAFAWWSDTGLVIDESDYSTFVPAEYTVKPIDRLQIRSSDSDIGILTGNGTNGYIIQENPFLVFSSDAEGQVAASPIYERLSSFGEYSPGDIVWFGDWSYRPGDVITANYGGFSYRYPIFGYTLKWSGIATITLESTGNEYREVMDAQSRETYAVGRKMLFISKTIDGVSVVAKEAKETSEGASEKVAELSLTVDGFNTRVSKVEDGQEELSSEIDQTAEALALKVSKGEVVSAINLTPEVAKILASKISLEGLVTVNEKFKVLLDGSIEATDGKFSGDLKSGNWEFNSEGSRYTNGTQKLNTTVLSGDFVGGGSGTRAFFGSSGMDVQYGADYDKNAYVRAGNVIIVSQNKENMNEYATAHFVRSDSGQMSLVCGESTGSSTTDTNARGNLGLATQYWDYTFTRVLRAGTYPGSSSRAIKQDIEPLENMGDVLDRLEPVSFAYKNDPNVKRYGLIYEDVKPIMPVLCFDDGKGDPGIVYTDLIPVLLKEIQSLRARVKVLEERM